MDKYKDITRKINIDLHSLESTTKNQLHKNLEFKLWLTTHRDFNKNFLLKILRSFDLSIKTQLTNDLIKVKKNE